MTQSPLGFAQALKSFVGYLEGTDKSEHTIKNYRLDVLSFQEFIESQGMQTPLHKLNPSDLDRFHDHLKTRDSKPTRGAESSSR